MACLQGYACIPSDHRVGDSGKFVNHDRNSAWSRLAHTASIRDGYTYPYRLYYLRKICIGRATADSPKGNIVCKRSIWRRNGMMMCAKCAFARPAPFRKLPRASASDRGNIVKDLAGDRGRLSPNYSRSRRISSSGVHVRRSNSRTERAAQDAYSSPSLPSSAAMAPGRASPSALSRSGGASSCAR